MNQPSYIINKRFKVYSGLNLIVDDLLNQDTRVEPRLIQVLDILTTNAGNLVSRAVLIKEVWDDYGGAGEALNHAMAQIRKILHDGEKVLIQTVPKKGYTIKADISYPRKTVLKRSKYLLPIAIAIVLISIGIFWWLFGASSDHTVSNQVIMDNAIENNGNTIETSTPDGKKYKLVTLGDSPPLFYINGKVQVPDSMEKHRVLIYKLKQELAKRRKLEK